MARPLWLVELIKKTFPGRFTIAELTKWPVLGRLIDMALFEGDDIVYLPDDTVIPIHAELNRPADMVLPSQVVEPI